MYFDFEDGRPDIVPVGRAISWREGVLLSFVFHLGVFSVLLTASFLPESDAAARRLERWRARQAEAQARRFVFVQPRVDVPAPQPKLHVDLSDKDRVAAERERARKAVNPLPFNRGTTPEPVETPGLAARRGEREVETVPDAASPGRPDADGAGRDRATERPALPESSGGLRLPPLGPDGGARGSLSRALQNLQRYVDPEIFNNPEGAAQQIGPLQFDTKGVEFGPWIRRFIAQIKRNWYVPYAAMSLRGHTVLTFYVHKDGRLTDIQVVKPSAVEAFTNAAFGALAASNPTQPLPPEYPADRAFFTVTFYYNEAPPR